LVLVDISRYFGDDPAFAADMQTFASNNGFGYIALYRPLLAANQRGIATHWPHDDHFNETGNRIFARAVYDWLLATGTNQPPKLNTAPNVETTPWPETE